MNMQVPAVAAVRRLDHPNPPEQATKTLISNPLLA
jgi:hypothetical protein